MRKPIRNLFIVGVVLILLLPAILTLKGGWPDFSDTGQIGDAIGGIMGPFVGILGAWYALIFLKRSAIILSPFYFSF